jgi:uncharacterized membrane protein YozB (DUF420 family)
MIPLGIVIIGYLVYQVKPFVGVPPDQAPTPPHAGFPEYYPLLATHITVGTIAMLTVWFQVWPWFRRHHPKTHRVMGRVYVACAVIGGSCGLTILHFAPPVGRIGVGFATLVWITTSVTALVFARKRKFVLHRRFMLYSFAIIMNNVWGVIIVGIGMPLKVDINVLIEGSRWVGWVVNLMLVQWWLYRTDPRSRRELANLVTVEGRT